MLSVQTATLQDLTTIGQLAKDIWQKHYVPIIGRQQVDYMLEKMYAPDALKKQVAEGQKFHLVLEETTPVGFISVSNPRSHDYFLHKFYLSPNEQNHGIGTKVFRQLFSEVYPAEKIHLTVNRQNYKSINFYFKLGFKIESVKDFDIGEGYYMNDFVMVWQKN